MKEKISDILIIIIFILIGIITYKITYSKTLASFSFIILIFYLLENKEKLFRKKEDKNI